MEAINFNNYYRSLGVISYPNNICTYNYLKNNRNSEISSDLKEVIELIKESVGDEKEDEEFYKLLLTLTTNVEDINIINSIIADERKHNQILRNLYFELTGKKLPENRNGSKVDNMLNYRKNLQKALMGELNAIKRYRKIMAAMPDNQKYALIMEILTDELRHANLNNFLFAKTMQMA